MPHVGARQPRAIHELGGTVRQVEMIELEAFTARIAGLVLKASAVAERNEVQPTADPWGRRERRARLDDAVFAGQVVLRRLIAA
jgi:hypothetical protein